MKIFYLLSTIIGIQFLFCACPPGPFDHECPPYCPVDSTDTIVEELPYELIWQTPLYEDTLYSLTGMNNLFNDNLFIGSKRKGPYFNEIVIALDGETGQRIWEWDDYMDDLNNYFKCIAYVDNNILYESTTREVHAIDLTNGQTLFQTVEYEHIPSTKISFMSGNLYHSYNKTIIDNPLCKLMVYNREENDWDIEFQIEKTDEFGVNLGVPSSGLNIHGDTILYFHNYKHKLGPNGNKLDLMAYNHSADSIYWMAMNIDSTVYAFPNSQNPPIIDGDYIYILLAKALNCFNRETGNKLWSTRIEDSGSFSSGNYILADDVVAFVSSTGYLTAIDKITGEVRYSIDHGGIIDFISYYKGRLYYTSKYLYIADVNTGELIHKIESHNYSKRTPGAFANGVAFNKELDYMYLNDGFYAMCIKIPE